MRVSSKFESAACDGLNIQKKMVENRVLLEHLAHFGPVIVLTNGNSFFKYLFIFLRTRSYEILLFHILGYLLHCDLCHSTDSPFIDEVR